MQPHPPRIEQRAAEASPTALAGPPPSQIAAGQHHPRLAPHPVRTFIAAGTTPSSRPDDRRPTGQAEALAQTSPIWRRTTTYPVAPGLAAHHDLRPS